MGAIVDRYSSICRTGRMFASPARRAFDEFDAAAARVRADQREVTGLLRINAPRVALRMGLTPVLREMARRHPRLTTEIITDDALVDVVEGGFDAGVRLGEMVAQDMVAVRLTPPFRAIMVAAPAYISVRGQPSSVADLTLHSCIGFRLLASGAVYDWELRDRGKEVRTAVGGDCTRVRRNLCAGTGVGRPWGRLCLRAVGPGRSGRRTIGRTASRRCDHRAWIVPLLSAPCSGGTQVARAA